jgi:CDP-diglyceride synthetase
MLKRTLTALGLAVIGLPAIIYGGVFYYLLIAIVLAGSAWEYVRLYRAVRYEPNEIVTIGSVLVIATARFFFLRGPLFHFLCCRSWLRWLSIWLPSNAAVIRPGLISL